MWEALWAAWLRVTPSAQMSLCTAERRGSGMPLAVVMWLFTHTGSQCACSFTQVGSIWHFPAREPFWRRWGCLQVCPLGPLITLASSLGPRVSLTLGACFLELMLVNTMSPKMAPSPAHAYEWLCASSYILLKMTFEPKNDSFYV